MRAQLLTDIIDEKGANKLYELVYSVYESESVEPEERRKMFHSLSDKIAENNEFEEEELIMLQHIKEDMQPTEKVVNGFLQLGMELPNSYRITLGDYGREKKHTKPNDNILHLQIRYCNLHFPEVFDRNLERGFSLNEVRALKDLIRQEKQLDTLAKIYFNQFIEKVERRYK